jgi:hypothetical protein
MSSTRHNEFSLPDVDGLRFRLRARFVDYYKTNFSYRQMIKPEVCLRKTLMVQSLAKSLTVKRLKINQDKNNVLVRMGEDNKQPLLLDLMDRDLRTVQVHGAAAIWLTYDDWRIHKSIEGVPEDLNYGLVLQELEPVLAAANFIDVAMRPESCDLEGNLRYTVLREFEISEVLLQQTREIVDETMLLISSQIKHT